MRPQRRRFGRLVATLAVAGCLGICWWACRRDPVTRENYEAVKLGMTEWEVALLLGRPGDYRPRHPNPPSTWSGPNIWLGFASWYHLEKDERHRKLWLGEHYAICIVFDGNGTVAFKDVATVSGSDRWRWPSSGLDRFWQCLGL